MAIIIYATTLPPDSGPQIPLLPAPQQPPAAISPPPEGEGPPMPATGVVPATPPTPPGPVAAPEKPQFELKYDPNNIKTWPIQSSSNPLNQIVAKYQRVRAGLEEGSQDKLLEEVMLSPIVTANGQTMSVEEYTRDRLGRSKRDPDNAPTTIASVMEFSKRDFQTLLSATIYRSKFKTEYHKDTERDSEAIREFGEFIKDPSKIPDKIADDPSLTTAQKLVETYKFVHFEKGVPGRLRAAADKWNEMFAAVNKLTGAGYNTETNKIAIDKQHAEEMGMFNVKTDNKGNVTKTPWYTNKKAEMSYTMMAELFRNFLVDASEKATREGVDMQKSDDPAMKMAVDIRRNFLNKAGKYYLDKVMISPSRYEIDAGQAQRALELIAPSNRGSKPQNKIKKNDEEEQMYNGEPDGISDVGRYSSDDEDEEGGSDEEDDTVYRPMKRRRASRHGRIAMAILAESVYDGQRGMKPLVARLLSEFPLEDVRQWYEGNASAHSDAFASIACEIMDDYSWAISGNHALDGFADDISRQRFVIRASVSR